MLAMLFPAGACLHAGVTKEESKMKLELTSSAFKEGESIPTRHTCDGEDLSPPLKWGGLPDGAKTLALICDDPDAPAGTWVHWVLFDLAATINELPEGVPISNLKPRATKKDLVSAMKGHILAEGQLMGTYKRK